MLRTPATVTWPPGVLVPIEHTIPEQARYTLFHQGRGEMIDHMLITRNLLAHYLGSEIHNELLHEGIGLLRCGPEVPRE